ncbi:MAG: precorrin-6Y C5,15-methyltransferase (decarboxylating) subunit CbiT [Methanomicrobiaceae archaeon]|nr:precorrin-6Y C5,15-methyltransferase (decarboxylating) subunit CbiT [Methanomicrobiaceae archaeon]
MGVEMRGGPTQDEILAISLAKMDLRDGDVVADIGCGTGKVAIAAARRAARVIAVDRRPEAIAVTREALMKAGCANVDLIGGEGAMVLESVDFLDCAFVGGSRDLERVLKMLSSRVRRSVVVNAVLLETLHQAVETLGALGFAVEVVHVQVTRSRSLAGGLMLVPINPVFIITGRRT